MREIKKCYIAFMVSTLHSYYRRTEHGGYVEFKA